MWLWLLTAIRYDDFISWSNCGEINNVYWSGWVCGPVMAVISIGSKVASNGRTCLTSEWAYHTAGNAFYRYTWRTTWELDLGKRLQRALPCHFGFASTLAAIPAVRNFHCRAYGTLLWIHSTAARESILTFCIHYGDSNRHYGYDQAGWLLWST